jgi:hypothetical protein
LAAAVAGHFVLVVRPARTEEEEEVEVLVVVGEEAMRDQSIIGE